MRTNIVIVDKLMKNTARVTGINTKREAVEEGLSTLLSTASAKRNLALSRQVAMARRHSCHEDG